MRRIAVIFGCLWVTFLSASCSGDAASVPVPEDKPGEDEDAGRDTSGGSTDARGGGTDVGGRIETDTGGEPDATEQPFKTLPPGHGLVSAGGTMRSNGHRLEFTLGAPPAGHATAPPGQASGRAIGIGIQNSMGGTP